MRCRSGASGASTPPGEGQVARRIRGLHAAFMDRSSLPGHAALDRPDRGRPVEMPGMPFFDYELLAQMGVRMPMPLIILDEAHTVLKDGNKEQRLITGNVVELARLIRKAGGRKVLATQLPSLADLGGSQALRDMLRGGNVWSGRTANKVARACWAWPRTRRRSPGSSLTRARPPGWATPTGRDYRPDAPMRTDMPGPSAYRNPPPVPLLDDRFLEVMDRAMKSAVSPTSTVAPVPAAARNGQQAGGLGTLLQRPPQVDTPGPEAALEGCRCVDAVWQVLSDRNAEMTRGEVIKWTGDLARSWGRKPWGIKSIQNALTDLAEGKDDARPVAKPRDGVYRAVVSDTTPQQSA